MNPTIQLTDERIALVTPETKIKIVQNQMGDLEFSGPVVDVPDFGKAFLYGFNSKDSYTIDDTAASFIKDVYEVGSGNELVDKGLFDILVYFPSLTEAKTKLFCYMWVPNVAEPLVSEISYKKSDNPDEPMAFTSFWVDYNTAESNPPNYLFVAPIAEDLSKLQFSFHATLPVDEFELE